MAAAFLNLLCKGADRSVQKLILQQAKCALDISAVLTAQLSVLI